MMRKLAAYAFLCVSLIRPVGVFCVEPTGDVQFEFVAVCCAAPETPVTPSLDAPSLADCMGCSDILVVAPALQAPRTPDAVSPSEAIAPVQFHGYPSGSAKSLTGSRGSIPQPASTPQILSTTVIRR